jgi:hypothetical protein
MALAGLYNVTIDQGATYSQVFTWKDSNGAAISLVGWTARMQVRRRVPSTGTLADLTTENGGIVLGGAAGTVTVSIAATATDDLPAGEHVYDLELVNGSTVERLVMGAFIVRGEVSR